jgi:SSS family solute:Na+ symporter
VLQAVILLGAAVVLSFAAFDAVGGWSNIIEKVPATKLSLIRPMDDPSVPWTGLITGVPILGFYFWCTNQFMVQRVLSARNIDHGRWGSLFAGLLKLPVLWLMVLPGTCAILLYPALKTPDLVYPTLMFDLLPSGLLGLVVAGFLAAIMSATASTFNSAATLFTMDFARHWNPDLDGKKLVLTGRLATLVFLVIAVVVAPQIERFGSVWQYLQGALSYTAPPIVAVFLIGLFWPRANARGASWAIIAGLVIGLGLFFAINVTGSIQIHFLHVAPILLIGSALAMVVGSLSAPPPPPEKTEGLLWNRGFFDAETAALAHTPAWANYRWQAIALLAATAVIVWRFA